MARGGEREREPQERTYSGQRQGRLHLMRGSLRHMQDRLREMGDHLRELDEHLRRGGDREVTQGVGRPSGQRVTRERSRGRENPGDRMPVATLASPDPEGRPSVDRVGQTDAPRGREASIVVSALSKLLLEDR